MTCIVALKNNGVVYMGADNAGVDEDFIERRTDLKLCVVDKFLIGFTSSFRMGQLLAYTFTPPSPPEDGDLFAYMVRDFVPAVMNCFQRGGFLDRTEGTDRGGQFLVAIRDRLFAIYENFQVGEPASGYYSLGSGAPTALGALYANEDEPYPRLYTALAAAAEFTASVRGPFVYATTADLTINPLKEFA